MEQKSEKRDGRKWKEKEIEQEMGGKKVQEQKA